MALFRKKETSSYYPLNESLDVPAQRVATLQLCQAIAATHQTSLHRNSHNARFVVHNPRREGPHDRICD